MPGFVDRELHRIAVALRAEGTSPECYDRLYAAQQALSWATDPSGYRSPFDWATGIPVEPAGCSETPRPLLS